MIRVYIDGEIILFKRLMLSKKDDTWNLSGITVEDKVKLVYIKNNYADVLEMMLSATKDGYLLVG